MVNISLTKDFEILDLFFWIYFLFFTKKEQRLSHDLLVITV